MRVFTFLACVMLIHCGPPNSLVGSIAEQIPLEFDDVQIDKQAAMLIVDYVKHNDRVGPDVVCKIVVDTAELGLSDGASLSAETFLERVTIRRAARDGRDFPLPQHGAVNLATFEFEADGHVSGDFYAVFASGRSLSGNFGGSVREVVAASNPGS